jgi:hypothetical protein
MYTVYLHVLVSRQELQTQTLNIHKSYQPLARMIWGNCDGVLIITNHVFKFDHAYYLYVGIKWLRMSSIATRTIRMIMFMVFMNTFITKVYYDVKLLHDNIKFLSSLRYKISEEIEANLIRVPHVACNPAQARTSTKYVCIALEDWNLPSIPWNIKSSAGASMCSCNFASAHSACHARGVTRLINEGTS